MSAAGEPADIALVRIIWTAHRVPVIPLQLPMRVNDIHVTPEPGHPFGRKGLQLAVAWEKLSNPGTAGMLTVDGDVLIDPADLAAMFAALNSDPAAVWTAPCKIWPVSTGRPFWTWDCWELGAAGQDWPASIDYFSFGFTYLPRRLLEAALKARPGLRQWQWPAVDRSVAKLARDEKIPMRVVQGASPKHLNW